MESMESRGVIGESGVSSKVESMESGGVIGESLESGGVSGESGENSTVERMESGGGSGESGGSSKVGCPSRLKCRPNLLLSLSHPKFSKAKQVRRPARKLNV